MPLERRILEVELEPDHMQRLTVPATGNLDAGHVLQVVARAGGVRLEAAFEGIVIGQRCLRHAATRTKFDQC